MLVTHDDGGDDDDDITVTRHDDDDGDDDDDDDDDFDDGDIMMMGHENADDDDDDDDDVDDYDRGRSCGHAKNSLFNICVYVFPSCMYEDHMFRGLWPVAWVRKPCYWRCFRALVTTSSGHLPSGKPPGPLQELATLIPAVVRNFAQLCSLDH